MLVHNVLFVGLGILAVVVVAALASAWKRHPDGLPRLWEIAVGFVTNFFDTLGVGSFAPTTALFKLSKLVPDEKIPGTLNVGHALPTIAEAFIFIAIVTVDPKTLALFIIAAIAGAWLGAGVVARWPRRNVQIGMGIALIVAAGLFLDKILQPSVGGGTATGLEGTQLWIGVGANFVLGALMTLGIGLYAPCLILVALLGMNPVTAFPIMMGSCAFLMPIASLRFVRFDAFSMRAALGLTVGGVPAVLIAAFLVKHLPLTWMYWLVIVVVAYTAIMMLRSAFVERQTTPAKEADYTPVAP